MTVRGPAATVRIFYGPSIGDVPVVGTKKVYSHVAGAGVIPAAEQKKFAP